MPGLVIDNASRVLGTLAELQLRADLGNSSHARREAAALNKAIAAIEYHTNHVEQERAALPLLCALVDAVRAGHAARDLHERLSAAESLERAMERAGRYSDDNR